MDLAAKLKGISNKQTVKQVPVPVLRSLPANEVQEQIKRVCFSGMHYPDIFSAIGKLVSGGICHEDLISNDVFFTQYISPESETFNGKTIESLIADHKQSYGDQVGSRPFEKLPVDCFSENVYRNLPECIYRIVSLIEDPRKRDVCLIGIITALSAAFSRYRFYHGANNDSKEYSPHLIALVLGAAGSGKGLTRYGGTLVASISHRAIEMRKEVVLNYKRRKEDYERDKKKRDKDGVSTEDLNEPVKPPKYCFSMSASDTTQAALVEILNENPIGGFAYDSEVDTLVQGNAKKDFGGFSDVIRKVFHHEPLSRQRKGDGESYNVEHPRLAVMLSGTHDQLKKLIPSESNGLFSRLWYYSIPKTFIAYSISNQQADVVGDMCCSLQSEIFEKADLWSDELIYMLFSGEQERELFDAMKDKIYVEEKHGGDIGASWLRMALITKRIAVTLAGMEGAASGIVPTNCWNAAMALLPALKSHCLHALEVVRMNQGKLMISESEFLVRKAEGKTDKEIAEEFDVSVKTLQRRKDEWTK